MLTVGQPPWRPRRRPGYNFGPLGRLAYVHWEFETAQCFASSVQEERTMLLEEFEGLLMLVWGDPIGIAFGDDQLE